MDYDLSFLISKLNSFTAQGNKRAMAHLTELKRRGNKKGQAARPTRQQAKDECVIC